MLNANAERSTALDKGQNRINVSHMALDDLASEVFNASPEQKSAVCPAVPECLTGIRTAIAGTCHRIDLDPTPIDPQSPLGKLLDLSDGIMETFGTKLEMVAGNGSRHRRRRGRHLGSDRKGDMKQSNARIDIVSSTEHIFHT